MLKADEEKCFFFFFLFVYLYMPMVYGINSAYFVGLIGCIFCLVHKKIEKEIMIVAIVLLIECFYVITLNFIETGMITQTTGNIIYLVILTLPGALFLTHIAERLRYSLDDVIEAVAITATIQAVLSMLCYLFGGFRNLLLISMGYDLNAPDMVDIFKVRLYGYAIGLTYAMPILQGIIGTITLLYALMKRQKMIYMLMVLIIWLSGIINGRTAFVVIAIGAGIVMSLAGEIPIKNIQSMFGVFGVGILIALCGILCVGNKDNLMWLGDGLVELFAFVTGKRLKRVTYFDVFSFQGFLRLPNGTDFFFGTGQYPHSDVGYVRNLWRDGLFFTIILYCVLFYFILRICKMVAKTHGKKIAKRIFAFSTLIWVLINIKGEALGISEFCNLIVLLYVMSFHIKHMNPVEKGRRQVRWRI